MAALTLALFFLGLGFRKPGRIGRCKGFLLVLSYAAYTCWVSWALLGPQLGPSAGLFAGKVLHAVQPLADWLAGLF